eukprot:5926011-Lingulodinium_polyedra.AAC.1
MPRAATAPPRPRLPLLRLPEENRCRAPTPPVPKPLKALRPGAAPRASRVHNTLPAAPGRRALR